MRRYVNALVTANGNVPTARMVVVQYRLISCGLFNSRVTKSYLLALGTIGTQISSYLFYFRTQINEKLYSYHNNAAVVLLSSCGTRGAKHEQRKSSKQATYYHVVCTTTAVSSCAEACRPCCLWIAQVCTGIKGAKHEQRAGTKQTW